MRRVMLMLALAAVAALPPAALAKAGSTAAARTWKGEVVDAGCYMADGAKATGESHKECAAKCFSRGMPAALLTAGGKLVLLVPDHQDGQPYKDALAAAGDPVEITGLAMTRNGMIAVSVTGVRRLEAK